MRRGERGKLKRHKRQNRITSKGIAKVSLLTIGTLIIVIAGIGFILLRDRSTYPREPIYPTATIWQDFTFWLEMPSEVLAGTRVTMQLKAKNTSNQAKWLGHGHGELEIVVTRQDGTKVWRRRSPQTFDMLYIPKLEPSEEYVITSMWWEQTDNNDNNVPPGIYIVQARYRGLDPGPELELPPRQLTVQP